MGYKHISEEESEKIFLEFLGGNGVVTKTAEKLGISPATVKRHTAKIAERLIEKYHTGSLISIDKRQYDIDRVLRSSKLLYGFGGRLLLYLDNEKAGKIVSSSSSHTGARKTKKKRRNTETIVQQERLTPVKEKEDGPVDPEQEEDLEGFFEVRVKMSENLLKKANRLLVAFN